MSLTQRLTEYISACFTGLWIESHEHDDALAEIAQMCRQQNWRLAIWDIERGLQIPGQANGQPADVGGSDPLAAIRSINALASADSSAILVLVNFQNFRTRGIMPARTDGRRSSRLRRYAAPACRCEYASSVARSWRRPSRATPAGPLARRP